MIRPLLQLTVLACAVSLAGGCALWRRDRCYLHQWRYDSMKAVFEETGSYQRVAQAMADEGWARCEVNTFRYSLRKDLGLEGPEYDELFETEEPEPRSLDFHPGYIPPERRD